MGKTAVAQDIGTVGVDSGMVCLIAKDSIKHWTEQGSGKVIALAFWGRDVEAVIESLTKCGYTVKSVGTKGIVETNAAELPYLMATIETINAEDKKVVTHIIHENSYDRLFCLEPPVAMQVDTNRPDLAYVVHTAYGDGGYGVMDVDGAKEVWFDEPPRRINHLIQQHLGTFSLTEETKYVFADPGFLEGGDYDYGCAFTLGTGEHDVYALLNKKEQVVCLVVK